MPRSPGSSSRLAALFVVALATWWPAPAPAERRAPPSREPDIYFVPTPQEAVDKMLEMAGVRKGSKVYDLGCGDGRIVVTAAKRYGARGVGVDIDPRRVKESRANARQHGVEKLVTIKHADIFQTDFSDADVVTLYLLPELNVRLMPQLKKLKRGARIISYDFDMVGAKPAEIYQGKTSDGDSYQIFKWVVPWEDEAPADHEDASSN